ncbi:proteasome assembly chaperone family protein [Haloarcula marina]|uniref:proteasome assembly chaperone family protein n=1 Tax=Haloarcula marina TaxID=2961574 RepID=UPI0020B7CB78|nr:PAC2 family protein [Halomicroarcula marina]
MAMDDRQRPHFELTAAVPDVETLVVGFTEYGLAGLTAVDYLTDQLPLSEVGYLDDSGPPTITPFDEGTPRHHTRVYASGPLSLAVVVAERFVPLQSTGSIADAIEDLCAAVSPSNLTVLSGVPVAHGPEDHVPFYIATEDYQERFLADTSIAPMGTGFVDGVTADLLARGIDDDERPVGVFTTPAHPQAPDAEAAIRLLDALSRTHGIDIDTEPLAAFAATVEAQYRALAERIDAADEDATPDDRMYM